MSDPVAFGLVILAAMSAITVAGIVSGIRERRARAVRRVVVRVDLHHLADHPVAARIRDRIDANQIRRGIDAAENYANQEQP